MSYKYKQLNDMSHDEQARYNEKYGDDPAKENVHEEFNMTIGGLPHKTIIKFCEKHGIEWTGDIMKDFDVCEEFLKKSGRL